MRRLSQRSIKVSKKEIVQRVKDLAEENKALKKTEKHLKGLIDSVNNSLYNTLRKTEEAKGDLKW